MDPTPKEAAEMLKQKGGKKGKSKPKTMHLSEFAATASSWADEVEDLPSGPTALPTGPSQSSYDSEPPRRSNNFGGDDDFRSSGRRNYGEDRDRDRPQGGFTRRDDRPERNFDEPRQARPRGELIEKRGYQIDTSARPHKTDYPTSAPFKLYLGNLNFRTTDEDIKNLLNGCKVLDIKIPQTEGRSRGFAYVEVDSIEAIHRALEMNGAIVQDRTVIIDLADVPTDQRDWRQRDASEASSGSRGFRDDRRSNPDSRGPRDFGNREPREFGNREPREPREYGNREPREYGNRDSRDSRDSREPRQPPRFSKSDEIGDWRTRRENPEPLTQREERPERPDRPERTERTDRPRYGGFNRGDQGAGEPSGEPAGERPKRLELKPRSEGAQGAGQDRPQKASPFGQAKPRDEAEAQRKVEERRKQREAEQAALTKSA